jgi:large subunit ribosomal protein L11
MEPESPVPVVINIYADRSFTFITKKPPVSFYIKKFSNVKSGSKEPGKVFVSKIKKSDIKKIAEAKIEDMNANDLEAAERMIVGSAFSMGIEVVEG